MSLATELKKIRAASGASLRTVEKATGISNAYLSQLERGEAENPSPDKLYALAEFFKVPYNLLMQAAGYMKKAENDEDKSVLASQAALMAGDLNDAEYQLVVKYIEFIRNQRR